MSKINKHPVVTSYRSVQDLVTLKDWFYNFNDVTDNRSRAVQRVKALASRGRLPHAIETTALLTSVALTDPQSSTLVDASSSDSNVLQLSYSMALVRFVNGLLDPFQQSNFAIPLHQLAKNLNLPSLFVELRHMGTHEQLPNLETLRLACKQALNWLYDNYWLKIEDDDEEEEAEEVEEAKEDPVFDTKYSVAHTTLDESKLSDKDKLYIATEYSKLSAIVDKIVAEIKSYKKIRKLDLDKEYKFGNSTDLGKKYWKSIKAVKELNALEGYPLYIIQTLMYKNLLIYNVDKINGGAKATKLNPLLIKLYKPLLNELGLKFKFSLLFSIFYTLNHNEGDDPEVDLDTLVNYKVGFTIHHDKEIIQLLGWAKYLMEDLVSTKEKVEIPLRSGGVLTQRITFVEMLLNDIPAVVNERRLSLLEDLKILYDKNNFQNKELGDKLAEQISKMQKELKVKTFEAPPSIEELLGVFDKNKTSEVREKRDASEQEEPLIVKRTKNEDPLTHYFFEQVEDWEPTAFGNSV